MTALNRAGGRGDWLQDAACRAQNPDMFFPVAEEDAALAKAICAGCQVKTECLSFAFESEQRYGVWGGLSEHDRAHLRKVGSFSEATQAR